MHKRIFVFAALLAVLLALSACGGPPEPGTWIVPDETNDNYEKYGASWIKFGVNEDSTAISSIDLLLPDKWRCNGLLIPNDHILFVAPEGADYELSEILPTYAYGNMAPITDGAFSVVMNAFVFEQNISDIERGTFTFAGEFSSPKKAAGTWELYLPDLERKCSGTWYGMPNPAGED